MLLHGRASLRMLLRGRSVVQVAASVVAAQTAPLVDRLFAPPREAGAAMVDPYWKPYLREMDRPAACALLGKLVPWNPLGYDSATGSATSAPRKGTLLEFVMEQKRKHADKVLLVRVGEFYETFGVDACMLVQHAGLNPMGNKARAGCPIKNIQATLDGLTGAGLSVAVYEELNQVDSERKRKLKARTLAQIVSPGSSTYIYDVCLRPDSIEYRENLPFVGITGSAQGYTMCEVFVDSQVVTVHERLTAEAVRVKLESQGSAEPIYVQDVADDVTSFLPRHRKRIRGYAPDDFPSIVLQSVGQHLEMPVDNFRTLLRDTLPSVNNDLQQQQPGQQLHPQRTRPRPLYTSTAQQLGLIPNPHVPDLIEHVLPATSSAHTKRFMRRWLLNPPPTQVADSLRALLAQLARTSVSLPSSKPVPVGKVVSLIAAKQCNPALFRDVADNLACAMLMSGVPLRLRSATDADDGADQGVTAASGQWWFTIDQSTERGRCIAEALQWQDVGSLGAMHPRAKAQTHAEDQSEQSPRAAASANTAAEIVRMLADENPYEGMLEPLSALVHFESGIQLPRVELARRASKLLHQIQRVVVASEDDDPCHVDPHGRVPEAFFQRNEADFRGSVDPSTSPAVQAAYARVRSAADELCHVVHEEFGRHADITYDVFNNSIMLRSKPKKQNGNEETAHGVDKDGNPVEYITPRDRNRRAIARRFTTAGVETAVAEYLGAAQAATDVVRRTLQSLSALLEADLIAIVACAHWAMVVQVAAAHTIASLQKGWALGETAPPGDALHVDQLTPFWLSRAQLQPTPALLRAGLGSAANTFDMSGVILLTAPNMSGKSTLMRSTMVAALLVNCGLFAPVVRACVPQYDCFLLRTASHDVPAEGKSALATEVDDARVMLRDCTAHSLVMVDELGKGTSTRDGVALAGALLEEMARRGMTGMFATHLHELLDLPLQLDNVARKRMGVRSIRAPSTSASAKELPTDALESREERTLFAHVEEDDIEWTYQMEDGECRDSLALVTARKYRLPGNVINRAVQILAMYDSLFERAGSDSERSEAAAAVTAAVLESDPEPEPEPEREVEPEPEREVEPEPEAEPEAAQVGELGTRVETAPLHQTDLEDVIAPLVSRVCGVPAHSVLLVEHSLDPPPAMEGKSCIYLLRLTDTNTQGGDALYVGETESIQQRLTQHRRKLTPAYRVDALVAPQPNKSAARMGETMLIQLLKKHGYPLVSDKDASHVLFGHVGAGHDGGSSTASPETSSNTV